MEKKLDDSKAFRTQRAEEKATRASESKRQKITDQISDREQMKFEKKNVIGLSVKEDSRHAYMLLGKSPASLFLWRPICTCFDLMHPVVRKYAENKHIRSNIMMQGHISDSSQPVPESWYGRVETSQFGSLVPRALGSCVLFGPEGWGPDAMKSCGLN